MRVLLPLLLLAGLAVPAAAADRRYAVADFDRVVVEGPYGVRITVGAPSSATASGTPQALDAVLVEVQGSTLRIRRNSNAWSANPRQAPPPATVTLTLTTRTLRSARVLGAGMLSVTAARGPRLDLSVEGTGHLAASGLAVEVLSLGLRGSGSLSVGGTARSLTADIQGSGSLAGEALTADTATLASTTSGEVSLTVRRTATITANGLGSVTILGTPTCTVRGPGAAEVRCGRAR